jgi:hypothetical protein
LAHFQARFRHKSPVKSAERQVALNALLKSEKSYCLEVVLLVVPEA